MIPIVIVTFGTISKGLVQGLEELETEGHENRQTRGEHPDYSSVEIGQNSMKSPGNLGRLALT